MADENGNPWSGRIKAGAAAGALLLALASGLIGYGVARGEATARIDAMATHLVDHEKRLSTVEQQFAYIRGKLDSIDGKLAKP